MLAIARTSVGLMELLVGLIPYRVRHGIGAVADLGEGLFSWPWFIG
jgi:hypothetical protein